MGHGGAEAMRPGHGRASPAVARTATGGSMVWRSFILSLVALAALLALARGATAGDSDGALPVRARLVLFETEDCAACDLYRREVLPAYWAPGRAPPIGLTLIDVDALGTGGIALRHRLASVPTLVLMVDGREIARVEGYPGRGRFFEILDVMARLAP